MSTERPITRAQLQARIEKLLKVLKRHEKRERRSISAGNDGGAVFWGIMAGETWAKILTLDKLIGGSDSVPAPAGPILRSHTEGRN